MRTDKAREIVVMVAMSNMGRFYRWGGDDPSGFDCSGLAVECLKSVGLVGRGKDATAAGMYEHFKEGRYADGQRQPQAGDLVFWHNGAGKVIHVEIVITDELSVGASGGGSATLTEADAIAQNAYVKIRPFRSRRNLAGFVSPYGLNPI